MFIWRKCDNTIAKMSPQPLQNKDIRMLVTTRGHLEMLTLQL
jgi:hypothetical protein